jgi:hypothetical protein
LAADELDRGIAAAQEWRSADAEKILSSVVERMLEDPLADPRRLARAYLYLAVAKLGLGREEAASAAIREALLRDPAIEVTAKRFPPKFVRFYVAARKRISPGTTVASSKPSRGSGKTLWIVGGGLAAAGGAAVALTQRGESPPACAPGGTLTATLTSTASGRTLNCTEVEQLSVRVVNDTCDTVTVSRVKRTGRGDGGNCGVTEDSYTPSASSASARQTVALLDAQLASSLPGGVVGCCRGPCPSPAPRCATTYEVSVETSAGTIAAGSYTSATTFSGCPACAAGMAATPLSCVSSQGR